MQNDYWSLTESLLSPPCIVVPLSAEDVSVAVSVLTSTKTRATTDNGEGSCQFAVKGGGHSPNAGFANIQYGITIDMIQLDAVSLNSDASITSVGAGATWLQVYEYMDSLNLGVAVAGGRNGNVGVGGLVIGGMID
jgi:FAD/FMN-containing dehydrogenase